MAKLDISNPDFQTKWSTYTSSDVFLGAWYKSHKKYDQADAKLVDDKSVFIRATILRNSDVAGAMSSKGLEQVLVYLEANGVSVDTLPPADLDLKGDSKFAEWTDKDIRVLIHLAVNFVKVLTGQATVPIAQSEPAFADYIKKMMEAAKAEAEKKAQAAAAASGKTEASDSTAIVASSSTSSGSSSASSAVTSTTLTLRTKVPADKLAKYGIKTTVTVTNEKRPEINTTLAVAQQNALMTRYGKLPAAMSTQVMKYEDKLYNQLTSTQRYVICETYLRHGGKTGNVDNVNAYIDEAEGKNIPLTSAGVRGTITAFNEFMEMCGMMGCDPLDLNLTALGYALQPLLVSKINGMLEDYKKAVSATDASPFVKQINDMNFIFKSKTFLVMDTTNATKLFVWQWGRFMQLMKILTDQKVADVHSIPTAVAVEVRKAFPGPTFSPINPTALIKCCKKDNGIVGNIAFLVHESVVQAGVKAISIKAGEAHALGKRPDGSTKTRSAIAIANAGGAWNKEVAIAYAACDRVADFVRRQVYPEFKTHELGESRYSTTINPEMAGKFFQTFCPEVISILDDGKLKEAATVKKI